MMRISLVFTLFILGVTSTAAQYTTAIAQAEQQCDATLKDEAVPGIAVAVAIGDDFIWTKGYGYANIEDSVMVDPSRSKFRIGSVSKTLTAIGLLELYEEGKLDLDDEVQEYVPEYPKKKYPITIRQVACHTAGIRHYRGFEFMSNVHYPTVRSGLVIFADDPLEFEPDTKYSYSSYGWNLISAVMETAAEQEFLAFMQAQVFKPTGMHATLAEDVTVDIPDIVSFYNEDRSPAPAVDNSYKWAGGGFLSTASDLLLFGDAIINDKLIKRETLEEALQTATLKDGTSTNRGVGFAVGEDKKGRTWYGHSGGSVGGSSMFLIYPEYQMCVVVLINQSSAPASPLAFKVAEQFLSNSADQ